MHACMFGWMDECMENACMYVYMYVRMCVSCLHVYMHVGTYVCMDVCVKKLENKPKEKT